MRGVARVFSAVMHWHALRNRLTVFVTCLLALSLGGSARAEVVELREGFEERMLGRALELAHDPSTTLTIDDALAGRLPFTPSTRDVPSFAYRLGADWAHVRIHDRRATRTPLVLEHAQEPADLVELFEVVDGRVVRTHRAGDSLMLARWPLLGSAPAFRLDEAEHHDLYVRLTGDDSRQLPIVLRTEAEHETQRVQHYVLQSLYFGGLLVMALYAALLGAVTRFRAYVIFAAYLVAYGVFQAAFSGVLFLPFPHAPVILVTHTIPIAIGLTLATSQLFAHELFDLGATNPALARLLVRAAIVIVGVVTVATAVSYRTGLLTALACFGPSIGLLFYTAVKELGTGNPVARIYLGARVFLIVGSSINVARQFGIVPTNSWSHGAQQVGSVCEIILLSLALVDRIRAIQAEATDNAELARELAKQALDEQVRANLEAERTNHELRRLDTMKDEFLANTSHELRTPLHGILGLSEAVLASEESLSEASRDRLQLVVASGRRLSALVNDILDFSKLRHEQLVLREKNIDLAQAVSFALTVVGPLAEPKGLSLRSDVERDVFVRADENRLQQILTNLLGNAVKFTAQGEVVVTAERRGGRIVVSVRDTGIGVPPEAQERIFQSFAQADGSTSRGYGGTGLGLAVTKKLVELHGGHVGVESSVGRGSTFTFDLAAADAIAPPAYREASSGDARGSVFLKAAPLPELADVDARAEEIAAPRGRSAVAMRSSSAPPPRLGRLVVADDDPVNLEVLRAQLEPAGYEVIAARDGQEALDALARSSDVDGVLLDVMMPNVTGPEAAERMRADHPHGTLPILMLTAKSRPEDAVVGLRAGASDYLGKPFHREELLQRIDTHLQASRTNKVFRRFVPEDFLALLGMDRFEELRAGVGQRHELTVLFADVRDFTARSELLGPERTFDFVNACHERFEPVIRAHHGFVDKFIGDAIMAIFPGDPMNAVRAAEGLQRAVDEVNASPSAGPMPLAVGIGIHHGSVMLGTVGGEDRLEVTVIGDAVNVAARLEALTKVLGVGSLVSEESVHGAREGLRRVGAVHVRGRKHPVELFEVLACARTPDELQQKLETTERFQRGLRAFVQGDMARAREHFAAVISEAPLDGLARFYCELAQRYERDGLPAGFDGAVA